jgi:hypothetical protein
MDSEPETEEIDSEGEFIFVSCELEYFLNFENMTDQYGRSVIIKLVKV